MVVNGWNVCGVGGHMDRVAGERMKPWAQGYMYGVNRMSTGTALAARAPSQVPARRADYPTNPSCGFCLATKQPAPHQLMNE